MLQTSRRGLDLLQNKNPAESTPIFRMPIPKKASLMLRPTLQEVEILVKEGQEVCYGEPLSIPKAQNGCPVISPFNARIISFSTMRHPFLGKVPSINLSVTSRPDTAVFDFSKPLPEMSFEEIVTAAKDAAVFDEFDHSWLFEKLLAAKSAGCDTVFINAVDDQPGISSSTRLFIERSDAVALGGKLCQNALNAKSCTIGAYFSDDSEWKYNKVYSGIPAVIFTGKYPANPAINEYIKKQGKGIIIGAGAAFALYNYIMNRRFQTTAIVTVFGEKVGNPLNIEADFGTPVVSLLEYCALSGDIDHLLSGSWLTDTLLSPSASVFPGMRAITTALKPRVKVTEPCIGCGRCVGVCPAGNAPSNIIRAFESGDYDAARIFGVFSCIGCSCCSNICPSKIHVRLKIAGICEQLSGMIPEKGKVQ